MAPAAGRENWSYITTFTNAGTVNVRSRAADDSSNLEVPGPGITLTVGTGGPPPPPTVSSVNPNSGAQGQSLPSVIHHRQQFPDRGDLQLWCGYTVNSCTFNSAHSTHRQHYHRLHGYARHTQRQPSPIRDSNPALSPMLSP